MTVRIEPAPRTLRFPAIPARWLVIAAVLAAVAAVLARSRSAAAFERFALLPCLAAVLAGSALVLRGWADEPVQDPDGPGVGRFGRRYSYRQVFGVALMIWGTGQLFTAVFVLTGGAGTPYLGLYVTLLAVPVAIGGALRVRRRTPGVYPAWRIALDAALLGVTLALVCWHFFAREAVGGGWDGPAVATVTALLADIVVTCLVGVASLRDAGRPLLLTWLGTASYLMSDLLGPVFPEGERAWLPAVLWALSWPLAIAGVLRYEPHGPAQERAITSADPDARVLVITTTTSLGLLVLSLGSMGLQQHPDRIAIGLVITTTAVFWIREMLNARFRAQLIRRLNEEAGADPLTGLANRRVLAARMAALPRGRSWCLLTVDLDGFKDVNDLLGHATGDRLLAAVARRLNEASPPDALVSRIGGDEFAVLLAGDLDAGLRVGGAIVTAVRQSASDVEGVARVEVSASVGVAQVEVAARRESGDGTSSVIVLHPLEPDAAPTVVDPLGALSASGAALRVAKAAGRNRVEIYDHGVARIRQRRLRVEERLRSAVETGAITVRFQPIIDLRRGQVTGAEALARWDDPELGPVEPAEFITVAEQTGLVVAIGERVLEETLSRSVHDGLFDRGLRMSFNVSPVQLRVAGFHQVVQEAMACHGVPRDLLIMEVTEQVLVEEGQAAQTLHRLADLGLTIAIDDFGTGYSALGYLQRLPADILKIDRSLTSSLVAEPRSRAITRAVLDLGRTVGLSVVVEGVETGQLDDLVRRMGVGYAQGIYYGRAMTGTELAAMTDRLAGSRLT